MNSKQKLQGGHGSKGKESQGITTVQSEAFKLANPAAPGSVNPVITQSEPFNNSATIGTLKKMTESKHAGSSGAAGILSPHQRQPSTGVNLPQDMKKQLQFDVSRNAVGSRGRSQGNGQSPMGGTIPRRNIQQFNVEQQQEEQQALNNSMMVQAFESEAIPNATTPQQELLMNQASANEGKQSRNGRASSTIQGRPVGQSYENGGGPGAAGPQFELDEHAAKGKAVAAGKYGNPSYSEGNTPHGPAQMAEPGGASESQAIKRIRDSRQRGGGKSMAGQADQENQLMEAYINQSVTMNQKTAGGPEFNNSVPGAPMRANEEVRIRAHTDLKKTGMQLGVKLHGIENSREELNQTTALTGGAENSHLSQGIQQFHSRGNSISAINMGLGIPNQNQKRSESVDKNAPHFHYNQSGFVQTAHFGGANGAGQQTQPGIPLVNQSQQAPTGANVEAEAVNSKDAKNPHFIHEAIERKIERFSRERNREGLSLGSSANAAQVVYNENLSNEFEQPEQPGVTNGEAAVAENQGSGNGGHQASRAFKAEQKYQGDDFDRKKKSQSQAGTQSSQNQMVMRGEIMSAGQANLEQRKILTGNNTVAAMTEQTFTDEASNAEQRNNYLNTALDGYQQAGVPAKKQSGRAASRGVQSPNGQASGQQYLNQNATGMQGIATGPLLAQKVVQLPKQERQTPAAQEQSSGDITDSKVFRGGKIKLDRLKKTGNEMEGSPERNRQKELELIELEQRNQAVRRPDGVVTKTKTTTAELQMQSHPQAQQHQQQQHPEHSHHHDDGQQHVPPVQGSQGEQVLLQQEKTKQRKEKIAVINLTTAKINVRNEDLIGRGAGGHGEDIHSEKETMEPDDQAHLTGSRKRLGAGGHPGAKNATGDSARSHGDKDYSQQRGSQKKPKVAGGKNLGVYDHESHKAGSNGSVAVSMRDESIMHMSVNSVTDGNFILHEGDAQSHDSNDHFSIKQKMIRYLSRVADRNKPLFVFNQKLNLGGDSSDDDTGTPSFSLVALIEKK